MADVNDQIRNRIESFVQELSELVRRAALESVSSALGGSTPTRGGGGRATRAARRMGGGKRSAEELQSMTSSVIEYLSKNPGRGVEDIGRELEVGSKELVLPIRKLVAAGQLTTEGQKRATKYFVADKPSEGKGRASKARRGAKKRGRKASGGRG
jgi:hypothetical protein